VPIGNAKKEIFVTGRHAVSEVLPFRVTPYLDPENEFFWKSGADGQLRILRCKDCELWVHPAGPRCRRCHSSRLAPEVVSGRATVATYTVNVHPWVEGAEPYIIGLVALPEQAGLYLTTNLVDLDSEDITLGMDVEVVFEEVGDLYYPLFRPTTGVTS
jgi:uncharacterized OB-fold protein